MTTNALAVWGLVSNLVGTGLLLVWPPEVPRWTRDGRQAITWVNDPTPHGIAKSWAQAIGTRFGLLLLMLGFALQLAAVLRGS